MPAREAVAGHLLAFAREVTSNREGLPSPLRQTTERMRNRMAGNVLSLFAGAGGLDVGLEGAGWQILAQVERDHDSANTLRERAGRKHARSRSLVLEKPIEELNPVALRKDLGLRRGELSLLAGGPPCQPFTTSGLRQSIVDQRASSLFPQYLSFVDAFDPRSVLLENVDGMLSAALRHRPLVRRGGRHPELTPDEQKGSFLKWLVEELISRGYAVAWGVLEAADFGVPQFRQRAIVIGVKGDVPCLLPEPQFGRQGLPPYRTLRWALKDVRDLGPVQPLSERKQSVYRLIPAGGNWRFLPKEIQQETMGAAFFAEGGRSGWWRRLAWDSPAPTILGMPDHSSTALVHPRETRCLSVNECAAIQTLPLNVPICGSPRSQYQQIGNAVPSLLGEALGRHVSAFLGGRRSAPPSRATWQKSSANRRIGTHAWGVRRGRTIRFAFNVEVRPDHVWSSSQLELPVG